jgi:hypothetical protein
MIKLILLMLWWPHKLQDAEINIEGLSVRAVERLDARTSLISYENSNGEPVDYHLPCTLEKHNQLVARFRKKLELATST